MNKFVVHSNKSACRKIGHLGLDQVNDRMVYDYFNNTFPVDYGSSALNLPPVPLDESYIPNKRARYTPDQIPAAISVASGKYVGTLTTPSDHRWELSGNHPVFTVVMVIYHYVERIWIIIVTPIFNITYTIMKNIIQVNQFIYVYNH